jgi:hypothetical protein
MKKVIIAIAVMLVAGLSARAQGTIDFANTSTSLVSTNTGGSLKTTSSGGNFQVALYWGVQGSTEDQLVQIGAAGAISPVSGRFNAGTRTTGNATAPGATATFQVRAWSGGYATYEDAFNSGLASVYAGKSLLWDNATGGAGSPASAPASFSGFQGFTVAPVPEPSTIALGVLGAGSLLFIRRKK